MEEKNPLEPTPITPPKKSNVRGRPKSEKAIKFTPQPKSIISRLLRRAKKQNSDRNKTSHSVIPNITFIDLNAEDANSKVDSILEEPELSTTYQSIQGTYAVDVDDNLDDYNNCLNAEKQDYVQKNTTTLWDNKCKEPKPLEITCYVCSHRSSSQQAHRKHLSIHRNQPYTCNFPDCKYTCKLSCNLIKHKRIHTSEKPFLCDQCTFRSNFANSLKVHKRIHTSERPYGCQLCSYKCNSSSNLKKHCRHRHRNIS
ncbi:zinc finger protein 271-like [Leguminivora glycinivorella]|uniref:zinc finger protein 271-like n=1 Tax=Leguminivora glycinivorella TaxID=1035111 RepID=UPI00200C0B54|nr:zinc finger protein 271-like [Leguminivora glycinivorella]